MASSTRSRSVSLMREPRLHVARTCVDGARSLCSRQRQHEPGAAPFATRWLWGRYQRPVQHIAERLGRHHLDGVEDLLVDLVQIAHVLEREDERAETGAVH